MKLTKRILSLCLALAMLLTVAAFPAFAEEYTPKTVEFVKTASYSKINQHNSNMSFALPQVDIYVGDTIKFSDTFFADNEFTYDDIALTGVSVAIRRCATQSKVEIYSWGNDEDSTYKASYTFTDPGYYMLTSSNVYYNDGSSQYKYYAWNGNLRWGVIEVKPVSEYGKVVNTPVTNKTEGDAVVLASATLDYLPNSGKDATVQSASILGSSAISIGADCLAGTVLGFAFNFETLGYIENITFTATNDNMFSAADIYGSVDGEDWYLIADDQQISPNGTSSAWESTTFTATVNAVAKYVKIKNFTYKGATYLSGISGAAATGFAITEEDLVQPEEPTTVDVTFVDVTSTNEDVVKTIDAGATVTIPDAYATGYKFYADEDCTEEITDLETRTFDANTTIYVKAETTPDPEPEQPTDPKAIGLLASMHSFNSRYSGPLFIARPADDVYVDSSLTIAANQTIVIPDTVYTADSHRKLYLVSDNSNTTASRQITGFEVIYGQNVSDVYHKAYVKVDENGVMSGFYSDKEFTTPANITFETAGVYLFAIDYYIDGTGALLSCKKYPGELNRFDHNENSYIWAVNVKDSEDQLVTAPNKTDYDLTSGTAITLGTNLIQGSSAVTATEGNLAYTEDVVPEGVAVDNTATGNTDKNFTIAKADNTAQIKSPSSALRIDFTSASYVESITVQRQWGEKLIKYDLYGSLDGEDWYLIGDANKLSTAPTDDAYHTISVDAVVKHLRVYYRDCNKFYGYSPSNITAITGQIGVEYIGGSTEPQVKDESGNVLFEEITDDVLATLPSYFVVSGKNYVVKSWTMDGEAIDYVALKKLTADDVTGNIVPELVEVPFDVAKLSKDATKAGEDGTGAFDDGAKYVNGLYIQGAQIRFPEGTTTAGLRFINVVDRELEATLEALVEAGTISGLDHGTLAIGNVNYDNVDLTVDNTGVNNTGDKIYKEAGLFNDEYYKYTLCVTGFQPEQYTLDVYVRPYITFTYGTETIYLYGEQYKTNYKAVVQEAVNVGGLSADELSYCNGILG